MFFVRVEKNGVNINGHMKRKVYIYKPTNYQTYEYKYASADLLKSLDFGRVNKEKHYILTLWEDYEILNKMKETFGKDFYIIFE